MEAKALPACPVETTLTLAGCLKSLAAVTLGNLVGGAALGVGYRFAYLKE